MASERPADSQLAGISWWSSLIAASTRLKVPSSALTNGSSLTQNLDTEIAAKEPHKLQGASSPHLERTLGISDLILLGVGASIGSGIFVVTGVVARDAGPGVVLSFGLAGLACVANALCYAELSARFPGLVGGAYLYAYASFGELGAFLLFCNLMFDYHIGAASLARSLASYIISLLTEVFPGLDSLLPLFLSSQGMPLLGGYLSLNLVAPLLLACLTLILCQGVRESATLNAALTCTKVMIVLLVVAAGAFKVNPTNWIPFAPNGVSAIVTAASVVFFSYVGFDAVANTAEESKNPQRDLPVGILASLGVCIALYCAVCLVITGMVPYWQLDLQAPLVTAFNSCGLLWVGALIGVGAVVGLTTALLAGLYVQARLYMAVGRDGLLPEFFAVVNLQHKTPYRAQMLVGIVAALLAGLFDVKKLSHILSVGVMVSYSMVCICVIMLRAAPRSVSWNGGLSRRVEAGLCAVAVGAFALLLGLTTRFGSPLWLSVLTFLMLLGSAAPLLLRQEYMNASGFACPFVPVVPLLGIVFNVYLVAQMHWEAWVRLAAVTVASLLVYVLYGQFHGTSTLVHEANSGGYEIAPSEVQT